MKKTMAVLFTMAMLAIPAFAWAGAVPDTGQSDCYDELGTELRNCPSKCDTQDADGNEIGCERSLTVTVEDTEHKKFFADVVIEGEISRTQVYYFGSRRCLKTDGEEETCPDLTCYDKSSGGVPVDCPETCYDSNKDDAVGIPCPAIADPANRGTGSDDYYGQDANYSINPPSYTKLNSAGEEVDSDWTKVTDNSTGLVWVVKDEGEAALDKPNNAGNTYKKASVQADFIDKLNILTFAGSDTWRLPTVKELAMLVNCSGSSPAIDGGYFSNMQAGKYWTSTSVSAEAYYVDFTDGTVGKANTDESYYVIAVGTGN
ncbi:DUF1566 domain-containing protein [Desulfococcaceae bacterium HSG8]|nr:DUF1566 domain-containing protein [Desulfococcaceae bacterium HSG8]